MKPLTAECHLVIIGEQISLSAISLTLMTVMCVCLQRVIRCTKEGDWSAEFTMCSTLQGSCSPPADLNSVEYSCDPRTDVGECRPLCQGWESNSSKRNNPQYIDNIYISNQMKPSTGACLVFGALGKRSRDWIEKAASAAEHLFSSFQSSLIQLRVGSTVNKNTTKPFVWQ